MAKKKKNKYHILSRYNIVLTIFVLVALAIVFCLVRTTWVQAPKWNEKADRILLRTKLTQPHRGQILADNGAVLAATVEYYNPYIDWQAEGFSSKKFKEGLNDLCDSLAVFSKEHGDKRTAKEWRQILMEKFCGIDERTMAIKEYRLKHGKDTTGCRHRYHILFKKLSRHEYLRIASFPFLKGKKAQTGFTYTISSQRVKPFGKTASLSIGQLHMDSVARTYETMSDSGKVLVTDTFAELHGITGLERALDPLLFGTHGKTKTEQLTGRIVNWETEVAQSGYDIMTTINIDIQDILEEELTKMCDECDADWGTAILMEVKTGKIKAITSLNRNKSKDFTEHGLMHAALGYEPGSVMKVISMTLALEKGLVKNVNEIISTGHSFAYGHSRPITDAHGYSSMPVHQIIESSSNIGMAKVILRGYEKEPDKYRQDLEAMGFFEPLKTGIAWERTPRIAKLGNKNWDRVALTRMCYGYSTEIPPLCTLAFYNAIANDGKYIRPRLIDRFMHDGIVDSIVPETYIRDQVCSPENAAKVRSMLRDVVWGKYGTAQALKDSDVEIAGKTGTCYVLKDGKYTNKKRLAFCGFFPYENPKYTCMVLISGANRGAARSSGFVLKNTALRMYARGLLGKNSDYNEKNSNPQKTAHVFRSANGNKSKALSDLGINNTHTVAPQAVKIDSGMPNVMGLTARDAISILENKGFSVKLNGTGVVVKQQFAHSDNDNNNKKEIILTLGLYK
ncbi:MAG: PASTA domain-containing protein [Bacteroidales bacterium]|nr:PASTA domain-containing protein [Bacteroidales bacterium]